MPADSNILYRINKDDVIVYVNESWNDFALANDAPDAVAQDVLNRSLWDFINGESVIDLYKDILTLIRRGDSLQFDFTCDASDEKRLMRIRAASVRHGEVEFQTQMIEVEKSAPREILDRKIPRIKQLVHICSWCKSINTGEKGWQPIDQAVSTLNLFNRKKMPQLTHGICDSCYQIVSTQIADRKLSRIRKS